MKKILLSVMSLALVSVVAFGATRAYFSDTETSTGNTFEAGSIDLQIDNNSWYNGVQSTTTSWQLTDLTNELFFDFHDVKPGDWGTDAISLHVDDNDSWVCTDVTVTQTAENGVNDPEAEAGDDIALTGPWDGELDNELNFVFWADDGNAVLESDETVFLSGPVSALPQGTPTSYALTDSVQNVFGAVGTPFPASTTQYLAKGWCFGSMNVAPVTPGAGNSPAVNPGFSCDGSSATSISQTDDVMGNVSFTAIQSRNNLSYQCGAQN